MGSVRGTTSLPTTPAGDPDTTVYLIGGYARYKCPFVWLRSKPPSPDAAVEDAEAPLKLRTTDEWPKSRNSIKVWDIIAELIERTASPPPENPFEIDLAYFDALPPLDRVLSSAALLHFLRKLHIARYPYEASILADMRALLETHFEEAPDVIPLRARSTK